MNEMMADLELILNALASGPVQPGPFCPSPEGSGETSFQNCFLGAFAAVESITAGEVPSKGGPKVPVEGVFRFLEMTPQGVVLPAFEQGILVKENSGESLPMASAQEVLGPLLTEACDIEKMGPLGKTIGEAPEMQGEFPQISPKEASGIPSDFTKVVSELPRPKSEGLPFMSDPQVESPDSEGILTQEMKGKFPEIPRKGVDGVSIDLTKAVSELSRPKGEGLPFMSDPQVKTPDSGKVLTPEMPGEALENAIRRFTAGHGDGQEGRPEETFLRADSSFSDRFETQGMRQVLPLNDDSSRILKTDTVAAGTETATPNRPLPVLLADGFMQQVLENLNLRTWRIGQREVRIQLHPEELGRLQMEIGMKDHQVVLKIHVDSPLVKDLIESNLVQLREGLADQGLRMERCSVTVSDHFQHPSGRNGAGGSGSGPLASPLGGAEAEETMPERFASSYDRESDLINLFI